MGQIHFPDGSRKKGSLPDALEWMKFESAATGAVAFWTVDENGDPCPVNERAGIAFVPEDGKFDYASNPWRLVWTAGGRWRVITQNGHDIGNFCELKTFATGSDFLGQFWKFGHFWPLAAFGVGGDGNLFTGRWEWVIPNAVGPEPGDTIVESMANWIIEDAGSLGGGEYELTDLGSDFVPPTRDEIESLDVIDFFRRGRSLVISLLSHVSDSSAPVIPTGLFDTPTHPALVAWMNSFVITGSSNIPASFQADANGFQWLRGELGGESGTLQPIVVLPPSVKRILWREGAEIPNLFE